MKPKPGYDPRTRKRSLLVKACMERKYSGQMVLELLDRVNAYPEEEREAEAARIIAELEAEPAQM